MNIMNVDTFRGFNVVNGSMPDGKGNAYIIDLKAV